VQHNRAQLQQLVSARFEKSILGPQAFFESNVESISKASLDMASRFHKGGRILTFGNGTSATDANHVSVEFVHPAIVGKRALPALSLCSDAAIFSSSVSEKNKANDLDFATLLEILSQPDDMGLGFSPDGCCENVLSALKRAKQLKLLTIGFVGKGGGGMSEADLDYLFAVDENDPFVEQEILETLYHILYESIHVFLDNNENLI
jgi:D-sedoheptulose 7-phosphate isomerase